MIDITKLTEADKGKIVSYIPGHANGNRSHPDVEHGNISSWNDKVIFVRYVRRGIPQLTAAATSPEDLVWGA